MPGTNDRPRAGGGDHTDEEGRGGGAGALRVLVVDDQALMRSGSR